MTHLHIDRRQFLVGGTAALTLAGLGCAAAPAAVPAPSVPVSKVPLPYLEVSGTAYECGQQIGKHFGPTIEKALERRKAWFVALRDFMQADKETRYQPFISASEEHVPEILEELRGWADGSGIPFEDLMALNLKAELGAMMNSQQETPGCSTLALNHQGRVRLVHNEDGGAEWADLMFVLKVKSKDRPAFLSLNYPGILSGNGPCMNEAGLVLSTNYIASKEWRLGVPRYFVDRAVLWAESPEQAIEYATHPQRAFAFHFNVGWVPTRQLYSVETSVHKQKIYEVAGLYVHTNHLIAPEMADVPQNETYVSTSSTSRYTILSKAKAELDTRLDEVEIPDLVAALASHEAVQQPFAPCRHPKGDVTGETLATNAFDLNAGTWMLYPGNPCEGNAVTLKPF